MTIIHIVGIKSTAKHSAQATLVSAFEALAEKCLNPKTGKPLITSFKCGKQNSPEGMTKGLEMIFVLEFENIEDRDLYLDDPAHVEFKLLRAPFIIHSFVVYRTQKRPIPVTIVILPHTEANKMTIVHIVAFKSEAPASPQQALISSFEALAHLCIHPETKKPYIKSLKAGQQNSPEEWTKGLELVFVLEFENIEDRDYYINEDPAHRDFGSRIEGEFKVVDSVVIDFEVGKW